MKQHLKLGEAQKLLTPEVNGLYKIGQGKLWTSPPTYSDWGISGSIASVVVSFGFGELYEVTIDLENQTISGLPDPEAIEIRADAIVERNPLKDDKSFWRKLLGL